MRHFVLWLLATGAVVTLRYGIPVWFGARARMKRALARARDTSIAEVRDGDLVKVTGVATARGPLAISPIDKRECIGYRVRIETVVGGAGSSDPDWAPVVIKESWEPFYVADATGRAVVEGPFQILLEPDDAAWSDLPASVFSLIGEAKVPLAGMLGGDRQFRFSEIRLETNDRVRVLGRASVGREGSRAAEDVLCHLRGTDETEVLVADADDPLDA